MTKTEAQKKQAKRARIGRNNRLELIARDRTINRAAFNVAFIIASHVNDDDGYAYPTQQTIGHALGLSERYVREMEAELERACHMRIVRFKGRRPSHYFFIAASDTEVISARRTAKIEADNAEANQKQGSAKNAKREELGFRSRKTVTGTMVPKKAEPEFRQNYLYENSLSETHNGDSNHKHINNDGVILLN